MYDSLELAFPVCDPLHAAYGNNVIAQIRTPRMKVGMIELPDEVRETEKWNTQVAKVISVGPLCFRNRDTLELWPEGEWFKEGEFVRVPKYGGDRWEVIVPEHPDGTALFILCSDLDVKAKIIGNPLDVIAYLA